MCRLCTTLRKYKTHSDRMIYGVKGDLTLRGIRHAIIYIVITFILGTFVIVFHEFGKNKRKQDDTFVRCFDVFVWETFCLTIDDLPSKLQLHVDA